MADFRNFDLGSFEVQGSTGLDAFFARDPSLVTPSKGMRRVASIQDLSPFLRLSVDTLIHKADKDLWAIRKQDDGSLCVERMFDDRGSPLKGA